MTRFLGVPSCHAFGYDRACLRCADIAFASVGSPDELKARRRALASKSYSTMLQAESSDLDALLLQVRRKTSLSSPLRPARHHCLLSSRVLRLMKVLFIVSPTVTCHIVTVWTGPER